MKAAAYNPDLKESSFLETIKLDKPQLTRNNAIVKVQAVGVCGSDLLKLDRSLVKPGIILGHELVGIIDEISNEMSSQYGFNKGDRIISSHHVPCLECDFCLRDKQSLCQKFKSTNFNPGAFCEYLELSEDHLKHTVQKIPDHLTNLEASFTEPVACCIKSVLGSRFQVPGINLQVAIIGLGSIGLIIGQLIRHYEPEARVLGIDLNKERIKIAKELGFDEALSPENLEPGTWNGKCDRIFLCAGADAPVDQAIKLARNGATITVFSSTPGQASFSNNDIYYKELTIKGSYSPNLNNLKEALRLISQKKIKLDKLISHKTSLENLGKSINKAKKEKGIKVLLEF